MPMKQRHLRGRYPTIPELKHYTPVTEAATVLGLGYHALYSRIRRGDVPVFEAGGMLVIANRTLAKLKEAA